MSKVLCKGTIYPWGILRVHAVWPLDRQEHDLWCFTLFFSLFLNLGREKIERPKRHKWFSYTVGPVRQTLSLRGNYEKWSDYKGLGQWWYYCHVISTSYGPDPVQGVLHRPSLLMVERGLKIPPICRFPLKCLVEKWNKKSHTPEHWDDLILA